MVLGFLSQWFYSIRTMPHFFYLCLFHTTVIRGPFMATKGDFSGNIDLQHLNKTLLLSYEFLLLIRTHSYKQKCFAETPPGDESVVSLQAFNV